MDMPYNQTIDDPLKEKIGRYMLIVGIGISCTLFGKYILDVITVCGPLSVIITHIAFQASCNGVLSQSIDQIIMNAVNSSKFSFLVCFHISI